MKDPSRDDEDAGEPAAAWRTMMARDDERATDESVASIMRRARPELARRRRAAGARWRRPVAAALVLTAVFAAGAIGGVLYERARKARDGEAIRAEQIPPSRPTGPGGMVVERPGMPPEPLPGGMGTPHSAGFPPDMVDLLELEPSQRAEVEAALARHESKVESAYRGITPDIERADADLDTEVRAILDDVQRERFELIRRVMPGRTRQLPP